MRAGRRRREQGVALVMVMVALIILGSITVDLMETNEVYLATTVNARNAVRAEYMARSGINLSRLILSFQRILGSTINFPFWQYADLVIDAFANAGEGGMLSDFIGLDLSGVEGMGLGVKDGDLKVTIIDEDSKLNVNVANSTARGNTPSRMINQLSALMASPVYDSIFDREAKGGQFFEREDIICEMLDWSDPDEDLCDMSGSEDPSFYQMLDPAYERKNAPYDSLMELHLVRGIDDDFWSAFIEPDPEDPASRVMTIWGKGRVNVNTAPPQVLFTLVCMLTTDQNGMGPCSEPTQVANLIAILELIKMYRSFMPFKRWRDFVAAIENPEKNLFVPLPGFPGINKSTARRMLTTKSTVFSIIAEGTVGQVTKRIHMVINTSAEDMLMIDPANPVSAAGGKVLYWRME
ncbi:MAG: general secretion pathway protein GspK [Proteobacteria bacterium]|nr:general secretion pathway protein GspK [Pseudomonadota bacterium]